MLLEVDRNATCSGTLCFGSLPVPLPTMID